MTDEVKKSGSGLVLKIALGIILALVLIAGGTCAACSACAAVGVSGAANMDKFQCRSKQSEAKGNLKALYVAQESFRAEKNKYATSIKELDFKPRGEKIRYEYALVESNATTFVAEGRGTGDMTGDVWRINEKNELINTQQKCAE
jgi:hypothetical protein